MTATGLKIPLRTTGLEEDIVSKPIQYAYQRHYRYLEKVYQHKANDTLRILAPFWEPTAAGYYRILIPLLEMRSQGLAKVVFAEEIKEQEREASIQWCNFITIGRSADQEVVNVSTSLQRYGKHLVTDQDDYPEAIIETKRAVTVNNWSQERLDVNQQLIRNSNLLTVTVPFLKEVYSQIRRGPIAVLPNQVDAFNKRWNFPRVQKKEGDPVIIGWLAGPSHIADSEIVEQFMLPLLKKRKNAIFKVVGLVDDWMLDIPKEQRILVPGRFNLVDYPKLMDDMDIGIAPIAENTFNLGKSDLKYLEYVMAGVLPVVSKVGPYLHLPKQVSIKCDTPENWEETLISLVDSYQDRKREYQKAMRYTINERTIYSTVDKWNDVYKYLLASTY